MQSTSTTTSTSTSSGNSTRTNSATDEIDKKLIHILSTEIQRDGGASLARDLKEYVKIDSLLKRCSLSLSSKGGSSTKLLSFIENYPTIFEVDRNSLPHIVYLVTKTDDHNNCDNESSSSSLTEKYQEQRQQQRQQQVQIKTLDPKHTKQLVKDRIICVLKKEKSKNDRRRQRQLNNNDEKDKHDETSIPISISNSNNDTEKENNNNKSKSSKSNISFSVNIVWLCKQCKNQIHYYLRSIGYYQRIYSNCKDVKLVGSNEWNDLIADEFQIILQELINVEVEVHQCESQSEYQFEQRDGRIFLNEKHNNDDNNDNNKNENDKNVQTMIEKIIEKVHEDGGTHISLSLLLHRYPELCKLVSGYDLFKIKHESNYKHYFTNMNMYIKNHQIYFQSINKSNTIRQSGRMEVDETGLFSVASSKWGKTFSSMMAYHCQNKLGIDPQNTIAIDLTSSVGGVTLPLAKKFRKVLALEIDEYRSILCHRNMMKYGVDDKVHIIHTDSVEFIPCIVPMIVGYSKIVVVDPPWGGMHYKQDYAHAHAHDHADKTEKKKEIKMGSWSMVQVMKRIYDHLSPTVVGIRMPLLFDYHFFFESLRVAGVIFESLDVKKAGPQLFLMLSV